MLGPEDIDRHVNLLAESIARGINRRRLFKVGAKGVFATVAGLTLGQLADVKKAFAATCTCDDNWTKGISCNNLGYTCPANGANCPSGCSLCANGDCSNNCPWQYGQWTSCSGLGSCGTGFQVCTDCKCPDCNHWCTCLSSCVCCTPCCRTPQEVAAELERISSLGANA